MSDPATRWKRALPILEDVYTFEDALLVGGMLITLLNNADRVKVACLAQLVNVIAPIMTKVGGGAWRQSIFHPFAQASRYGRGTALRPIVVCDRYDTKDFTDVPAIEASAVVAGDGGLALFAVNRTQEDILLSVDLRAFGGLSPASHSVLHNDDPLAVNTEQAPDAVAPVSVELAAPDAGKTQIKLPAMSWNTIRYTAR